MVRVSMPAAVQTEVLVSSRRRCCICYGLNRDTDLKSGQIAHLDRNNSNHAIANLAFLCFNHHDEYDSTASQRKNFTIAEVKSYRSELIDALGVAFRQKVHFGEISLPPGDPYAGKYILISGVAESAEVIVTPVPDDYEGRARYVVSGFATRGNNREFGPNMGVMDFVATMENTDELQWCRIKNSGQAAASVLRFSLGGKLTIDEFDVFGEYGQGVEFTGTFQRARRDK